MEIKSVAVLGAGAVGSYVIWGLSGGKNIELGVVAEGERAKRLKEKGCTINHTVYHPHVWTPQEAHGVDLLVVSLKYGALPGALESIREAVGENTIVMSLMNGVDSEEMISTVIPKANIMYSLIKVASHKEEDGYCFDPELFSGNWKHLMKVKGCVQSRNFLQIQGFIFAIQTISGRRCGANSG